MGGLEVCKGRTGGWDADITFGFSFSLVNSLAFFLVFCINIRTAPTFYPLPSLLAPLIPLDLHTAFLTSGLLSLEFMRTELAFVDSNKSTASGGILTWPFLGISHPSFPNTPCPLLSLKMTFLSLNALPFLF